MTITLYYFPGACSFAPHVLLEEVQADYRGQVVDLANGAHRDPGYLAVNPKGLVPALDTGSGILTEVPAISYYIAALAPDLQLWPRQPELAARCLEWLNWLSTGLHAVAFAQLWRPERFVDDPGLYLHVSARGRKNILAMFEQVEARLSNGPWVLGETYTVVDPFIAVFYRWGCRIGADMANVFPHWTAHTRRFEGRPAVQRALAQENISLWR